jgi:hypothetical protein
MKKLLFILFSVLSMFFIVSCSGDDSQSEEPTAETKPPFIIPTFTISEIPNIDNLIVADVVPVNSSNLQALFAVQESGNVFTNDNGEIIEVELPPGFLVKKPHKIENGNSPGIALTLYLDTTGDSAVVTCVLTETGLCDPEEYEPRKMSGLGNSPFFHEFGNKRRYLTGDKFITHDLVTGEKIEIDFPGNGQVSINNGNGHMMIFDGIKTVLSGNSDIEIPETNAADSYFIGTVHNLRLNETKFYIPHKSGFMVKGSDYNDFYRVLDNSGDLDVRMAQQNAYYQYVNVGGGFNRIFESGSLINCTSHIVGEDDIMICDEKIYLLGDASNDILDKNINYSGHYIYDLTIKAGNSVYFYSKNNNDGSEDFFRLSKEDVVNEVSTTITENYKIVPECFDVNKAITDSIDIGAYRVSDNVQVVLKIINANTTPEITETIGQCDQIVSF